MDTKQEATKSPVIAFSGGDYKPRRLASGLIGFRAPYDLPANQEVEVKLNTRCSVFLLFTDGKVVQPGEEITLRVKPIEHVMVGEVFARAYPLLPVDYVIG